MRARAPPTTLSSPAQDSSEAPGRRQVLQRLFSTFPGGWPGAGLLLLRAAAGLSAAVDGAARITAPAAPAGAMVLGGVLLACGALLLVGFLTPIAGLLGSLAHVAHLALAWLGLSSVAPHALTSGLTLLVLVVTFAIVLLGPGALSFDAYLFGRREIVIPHDRRHSS